MCIRDREYADHQPAKDCDYDSGGDLFRGCYGRGSKQKIPASRADGYVPATLFVVDHRIRCILFYAVRITRATELSDSESNGTFGQLYELDEVVPNVACGF